MIRTYFKRVLIFGDSNTDEYIDGAHVEQYPGLTINDMFWFLLSVALEDEVYDQVIISIGTNDFGLGITKSELIEKYGKIKEKVSCLIIGPYGDVDTLDLETLDGVHFTDKSKKALKETIKQIF